MKSPTSVLVVDSDSFSLSSVVECLQEQSFHLYTADNGKQCLEIAAASNADLILLDIALHDISGLDICRQLKSQDLTRDIPIIFTAALDSEESRLACFEAGGVDYLPKPLRLREMVARIKVHLKPRAVQKQQIEVEHLEAERANTQWLSRYTANAPGCFYTFVLKPDGSIAMPFASSGLTELIGLRPEELAEDISRFKDLVHPEDDAKAFKAKQESARSLSPYQVEFRIFHPSKGLRWIEARSIPEREKSGDVAWHGFMYDVTERKLAEEKLWASEQSFRAIADHSPDVVIRYDQECRRIYVSESYVDAHHLSPETVLGKKPSDLWKSLSMTAEAFENELYRVMETGCLADIEFDWQKTPDQVTHFWLRAVPEYDREGKAVSVLAMARDITAMKRTEAELAERERDFRTLIESIPDNIIRYAKDLRIRYANPVIAETFGIPQAEWFGKYPNEVVNNPIFDEYHTILRQVIQSGKPADYLLAAERSTEFGRDIYDNIRFVPEFAADGSIIGAIAIGRNLLEQRKLELEVALREEKFRTLAENIPEPIVRYDLDGRRIYSNRAYIKNGPLAEDSLGKTPYECWWLNTPTAAEFMARLQRVIETKTLDELTVVSAEKEGEPTYLVLSLMPEFGHNGEVISVLEISRDITRIMRAEALLRKREQEFRTLAHNSPDMIVRYDRHFRRVYINPAYSYYTGIPISSALNKTPVEVWTSLMPSDEYLTRLKRVMDTRESDRILLEWFMPDGSIATHLMHAVAECADDGKVTGVLVIGHNITELKATERRLEESRAQLQLLTYHREEAREEERRRVAREIHDELGQLLSVLRLNVSTLEYGYGEANPGLRKKTAMMGKVIDQAIDMIHNLATRLRPAVLESGISLAIEWLVQEFAKSTGINCEFENPEGEIELEKDRALAVFRIVQESMTNILRHAEADHVEIAMSQEGQELRLKIKDNGKGFIPEKANDKDSFGIIGMKERILMLGGTLEIYSGPGLGTELLITVPINEVKKAET